MVLGLERHLDPLHRVEKKGVSGVRASVKDGNRRPADLEIDLRMTCCVKQANVTESGSNLINRFFCFRKQDEMSIK